MANITRDEWMKALGEAAIPADPESLTISEIGEQFGVTRQAAYRRIRLLVKEKRAIRTFKNVTTDAGHLKRLPSYRLVKKGK